MGEVQVERCEDRTKRTKECALGKARKIPAAERPKIETWPPGIEDFLAREMVFKKMRETVDMVQTWEMCGRPACRKARGCRDRQVSCFDEFSEAIQGTIQELADWERFDGPFEESWYAHAATRIREAMDRGEF
jgi:hypothetical protein